MIKIRVQNLVGALALNNPLSRVSPTNRLLRLAKREKKNGSVAWRSSGMKERDRRRRQIAAGQLRIENGLVV